MKKPRHIIVGQRIDPAKLKRAKELRRQMTPAEKRLWARLRRNQLGFHFRRQQIIDGFIVDFYCHTAGLVVEVDGPIHEEQEDYDESRDDTLTKRGLYVLRVTNEDVMVRLEQTLHGIAAMCQTRVEELGSKRTQPPVPFPCREGGKAPLPLQGRGWGRGQLYNPKRLNQLRSRRLLSMVYTTLISTEELTQHLTDPDWAVVDCRFSLDNPARGRQDYHQAHIAGAIYAHLNEDLSGPIIPGKTGRHPLPEVGTIVQTLSKWGIDTEVQVVAYDDAGGAVAARLWWLLRWLGHQAVAVLDGGWPLWQTEGRPVSSEVESRTARNFIPNPQPHLVAETAEVLKIRTVPTFRICDSRSAERYRGENEPIDPVAGRIPGAVSTPFADNLAPDGRFRPEEELRTQFKTWLGDVPVERAVFYCGSGVTAAHNVLALAYAGLGDARLYAGSWSEWITDPERPVARG